MDGEKRLVLLVACHGPVQGRISGSLGPTTSTLMLSVILREYLQAAGQTIDDVKRRKYANAGWLCWLAGLG